MADESELATEAGPEVEQEETEGQEQTQAAEGEEAEPKKATKEPEESEDDPEEKKRETAKERRERDKAYKQRLRDQADEARARAKEAEARLRRIVEAGKSETAPQEKDFSDYTEFVAAKAAWASTQRMTDREARAANSEAEEARKRAQEIDAHERQIAYQSYGEASAEARQRYADFDAVVGQPGLFPSNNHLPDLIVESDMSADLAYVVASDRNLHDRLVAMPPLMAARELGRIEAQLTSPRPRTQTQAPAPISPVKAKAAVQRDPSKMSYAEYVKWRKGQS